MTPPSPFAKDLQIEPVREAAGWRLSWTWWELDKPGDVSEGWDFCDWPSTDAMFYPTRDAAIAALAAHRAAGALPKMETPEYGPA